MQYLKFGWTFSSHTWTVNSSKGCLHFPDNIVCVESICRDFENLSDIDFVAARGIAAHRDHFVRRCPVGRGHGHTFLVVTHSHVLQAGHV